MALSVETLAASKHYTDDSISGITGVLAGKNCTIGAITDIAGGHRVTFKWTADDGTVKTATMDVKDGPQGIQGVKGDTGNTGATGATGEKGDAATITIGTVQSGASPAVTNSGTSSNAVLNFTLPKGDKGDRGEKGEKGLDGKSFEIKAKYANLAALIAEHPTGTAGEAYLVGDNDNPDLYIWLTEDEEWFNNGKIAGVKGDKGDTGDDGYSPVASVTKSGHTVTISIQDKTGQTTETVSDGQDGADGSDGASAYDVAVEEGFVGSKSEWLASLVGATGAAGANGTNGSDGISPVANVTKNGDVIKIHIQDAEGITEQTIDTSTYATKSALGAVTDKVPSNASVSNKLATASDITGITEKIPSNASSSNKLVTKSDAVIKHDYSITGTTDAIADTKALVNHIISLGEGTYAGEFKRSGITFGSYRLTYVIDGIYSKSVSGLVTYSINVDTDATYQVSYVEDIEHGTPPEWKIEKLVTESDNNFKYQVCITDTDLNNIKTSGVYSIYISDTTSQATNHAPSYGWLQLIVIQMNNSSAFCNQILCREDVMYIRKCGNGAWSDWKQIAVNTVQSGTYTIPAQTLQNLESAEVTIPLTVGDFYCGRIDFANLPSVNMNLSYNDFSGQFQDARETVSRSQFVLYPIGKVYSGTLHIYLTNYTGSAVTIGNVQVNYYLEHHSS